MKSFSGDSNEFLLLFTWISHDSEARILTDRHLGSTTIQAGDWSPQTLRQSEMDDRICENGYGV